MNTILILSILAFGAMGILIKNYWEVQLAKIVQKQVGIKASINALDVLNSLFGNSVKINRIERTKGIGADYYSPLNDEFFLTEDTEKYNSASVIIAYFLGLLKITSKKGDSSSIFINVLKFILNPSLVIFIIISIFSSNTIYIKIMICIYVILIILEIITNKKYLKITNRFVVRSFKANNISIPKDVSNSLSEYVNARWWQLATMFIFYPLLVSYYFVFYIFRK